MKHLRIPIILFAVSLGCKPLAESQTVEAQQPRQEHAPIPAS